RLPMTSPRSASISPQKQDRLFRKEGTSMTDTRSAPVTTTDYQRDVANYWNSHTNDPVNLELGKIDDIYHHHYGLGMPDPTVLQAPSDIRDDRIIRELHRLET